MAEDRVATVPIAAPRAASGLLLCLPNRLVIWSCAVALLLAILAEPGRVLIGRNLHVVIPQRVLRCAQQSGDDLADLIRAHGIRTVVNLRGSNVPCPWYVEEARTTHALDVGQEDICFSATRLPSVHEVRHLVEVLERAEPPLLLHCRRGADRTGLAAAIAVLLLTDASFPQASRQLGVRYGHVALGRTAYLDHFLDQYAGWLEKKGIRHDRATFKRWVLEAYVPGGYRCRVEPVEITIQGHPNKPVTLRVRVHNTGTETWHLRSESNAGVHVGFIIWDVEGHQLADGRSGLFDAEVPPGQSTELTLVLPAWMASGHTYRFIVDMVEEQQFWFFQTGSEPWEWEFEVPHEDTSARGELRPARTFSLAH